MLLRETLGVAADSSNRAFRSEEVQQLFKRPTVHLQPHDGYGQRCERHVILACDPSGGGGSAFALASLMQLPNGTVLVSRCYCRDQSESSCAQHSAKRVANTSSVSGDCAQSHKKRGMTMGSTRDLNRDAYSSSGPMSCSRHMLNRSAARLHVTTCLLSVLSAASV